MGEFGLLIRDIGNEDQRWIGNGGQPDLKNKDIVLDRSLFGLSGTNPRGFIKSGTPLGLVTATGLYGPYGGGVNRTEEVQTVTEGGSGLTSFTLTFSGQTTGSIAAGATAAAVQAALVALSNIAPGDVVVTGADGGPFTVTFGGAYADTNVAQMTATPTGGSGTVTVATQTAGGAESVSDGREVLAGHLFASVDYDLRIASANLPAALFWDGVVIENYLPSPVDANGKADVAAHITYVTDNVGP